MNTASTIRLWSAPTGRTWIISILRGRAPKSPNWTILPTMAAMSPCTLRSRRHLREHSTTALGGMGREGPLFPTGGALAFRRDLPDARVTFFPTGHFALETHADEIAAEIMEFLTGKVALRRAAPASQQPDCHGSISTLERTDQMTNRRMILSGLFQSAGRPSDVMAPSGRAGSGHLRSPIFSGTCRRSRTREARRDFPGRSRRNLGQLRKQRCPLCQRAPGTVDAPVGTCCRNR